MVPAGSSPHVQGAPGTSSAGPSTYGAHPRARAGSTRTTSPGSSPPRAHPRACGEHSGRLRGRRTSTGSSPRVRGAQHVIETEGTQHGLIPARAGSTTPRSAGCRCTWAHPRACGEHEPVGGDGRIHQGSSPRVRGALAVGVADDGVAGLIPARAGSTSPRSPLSPTPRAHPRACGEHPPTDAFVVGSAGSSPRVRGAQPISSEPCARSGLIPARAGSTLVDLQCCRCAGEVSFTLARLRGSGLLWCERSHSSRAERWAFWAAFR